MLRLKRLELHGFKSFCERTELKFPGAGVAAIVGPNGCGKSNLSDAISWVLGEQSAKSLRGARMEDVIFAGTRERKPLGLASVTMSLVEQGGVIGGSWGPGGHLNGKSAGPPNGHAGPPEGQPGRPGGEITITRRLYRSGESEYLIDGKSARLRDIQDIFMGSGLGPECYAIIEQGRIGQILSSKPYDRRAIIEEAAGITKFKTRKRLAEAKLESARQNLARVFDILEEVTRQVNSLKRQASKARRYAELKAELEARLTVVLAGRCLLLEQEIAQSGQALEGAAAESRELAGRLAAGEAEHAGRQKRLYGIEQQLTGLREGLAGRRVELERARGRVESQAKEAAALEQRAGEEAGEAAALETRLEGLERELGAHRGRLEALEVEITAARERGAARGEFRESLQAELREREKALEEGRLAVLRLMGEASTLRNQMAQIEEFSAGLERETSRAGREEQGALGELGRLNALKQELGGRLAARQLELDAAAGDRRRTEERLGERKQQLDQARGRLDTLRAEYANLKGRKASLDDVLAHRSYATSPVRRLFEVLERGRNHDFRLLGILADFIEVDPGFEKSAEEFLHDELDFVVVETWDQAARGLELLRGEADGRATFLVHPEKGAHAPAALPEPETGAGTGLTAKLSDSLRLTNGLRERATGLLPRISRCFLAEDHARARELAIEYPHLYFLLPDGAFYHGHTLTGGKKTASGPLAIKREARELVLALEAGERELRATTEQVNGLTQEVESLESELARLRDLQQEREKSALALEHEMRKMAEEAGRNQSRLSVARMDLERLRQEGERAIEQLGRSRQEVEERESLKAGREQALEAGRLALETLAAQAAAAAEEHSALRVELAGLEERGRGERTAMARLAAERNEVAGRHARIGPEIERLKAERARLLAENATLEGASADLAARIAGSEDEVGRLAWQEAQARDQLLAGEAALKQHREGMLELQQKRSEIEIELVKRQAELGYLDETSRKELGREIREVAASLGTVPEAETMVAAEQGHREIREKIEALGPVNPEAMNEYQEAQQRQDFLSSQRQDLLDSIRDTEKALEEIDRVSRQKFADAFEAINQNFREAFRTLFGGGMGEMRLTDEANPVESGIDIVASPPGKRLQNVLLLSGGEKSLAAMALLMAIFRYQPSPFCVLDEVDAALDEANIERLMQLLKEMSLHTQFVLITHSKRTMESAQALYGVTMQEPGVSKLVSVRFDPGPRQPFAPEPEGAALNVA